LLVEVSQSTVQIEQAVFKIFVSRPAEFSQITGAGYPVVTARIDDETMISTFRQLFPEDDQRRQVKIHRYAVNEHQRKIRPVSRRREEQAVESLVVSGFESAQLRVDAHCPFVT
jgi:hypothetical protein